MLVSVTVRLGNVTRVTITCSPPKGPLFQHSAVPIGEDHIKYEVEPYRAEKGKVGEESPQLVFLQDKRVIKIQLKQYYVVSCVGGCIKRQVPN